MPITVQHSREKSSDSRSPPPEYPRSPDLLRKAEAKGVPVTVESSRHSSRWESSSQQSTSPMPWKSSLSRVTSHSPSVGSERSRKIDEYDPIAREKERESEQASAALIDKKDDRLGYTVAQYGNGGGAVAPGQTVSSRTFTGF
ncbi:unnamed protein product [Gongylonema pulchrum]|uniref:Uncharacterized protein n=1 Tax=Gongylonema pulchrum TaxID=637853 RepID=A0A3P7RAV1_9BILA|nr:unnamed protein product [Gongylonema pulchrum]